MKSQRQFWCQVTGRSGDVYTIQSPLTLELGIERGIWQSISNGVFRIYNLKESTRSDLYHDWYDFSLFSPIVLRAGYASWNTVVGLTSQSFPIIFQGTIRQAYSQREGSNWVTTIMAWDGGQGVTSGDYTGALDMSTSLATQINSLIAAMPGVMVGYVDPSLTITQDRATSFVGSPWQMLQSIADAAYADLFIDLQKVYIVAKGSAIPGISGGLGTISPAQGLLETPMKQRSIVSFPIIFEPRVLVGQSLVLQSIETVNNGSYTVGGISHHGTISDAVGGDLRTQISCYYGPDFISQ